MFSFPKSFSRYLQTLSGNFFFVFLIIYFLDIFKIFDAGTLFSHLLLRVLILLIGGVYLVLQREHIKEKMSRLYKVLYIWVIPILFFLSLIYITLYNSFSFSFISFSVLKGRAFSPFLPLSDSLFQRTRTNKKTPTPPFRRERSPTAWPRSRSGGQLRRCWRCRR